MFFFVITLSLTFHLECMQTFVFALFFFPRVFHNQSWHYKPKQTSRGKKFLIDFLPESAICFKNYGSTWLSQDSSVLSVSHDVQVLQGNWENVAMVIMCTGHKSVSCPVPSRARRQKVLTDATYALSTQCETCARQ